MLLYGKSIVKHSRWWYGDTDLQPLKRKKPDQPSREPHTCRRKALFSGGSLLGWSGVSGI